MTICNICLRTDVIVYTITEELRSYYEEICNFSNISGFTFCSVCTYKILKSYDFKKMCNLACKKLKEWRTAKKHNRTARYLLHKEIPTTLGVCDNNNRKVYFYNDSKLVKFGTEIIEDHSYAKKIEDSVETDVQKGIDLQKRIEGPKIVLDAANIKDGLYIKSGVLKREINVINDTLKKGAKKDRTPKKIVVKKNGSTKGIRKINATKEISDSFDNTDNDHFEDCTDYEVLDDCDYQEINDNDHQEINDSDDLDSDESLKELKKKLKKKKKSLKREDNEALKSSLKNKFITKEMGATQNDTKGVIDSENDNFYDDTNQLNDSDTDTDESLKELITLLKDKKKLLDKGKGEYILKKNIDKNDFNIDALKGAMKKKFERHGEVKDALGNVIHLDNVFKNLDYYSNYTLLILKRLSSEPGPLRPNAIQRLSKIQDRFKSYEKLFEMTYLSDQKQMEEEFQNRRKYTDYLVNEHRCEKCIKGFKFAKILENHNRLMHNESQPHRCPICQCRYSTALRLARHISASHAMVYKCKLCKHFITNCRNLMVAHHAKHTGLAMTCKECGKQYQTKSSFYMHVRSAHARYVCPFCAAMFHRDKGLALHINYRHGGAELTEGPDNVKCDVCDTVFINNDVYNKHTYAAHLTAEEKMHLPRKKRKVNIGSAKSVFTCQLCEWTGTTPWSRFHHHTRTHPNEEFHSIYAATRKYLCHTCGKGLNSKQCYIDHMNKHTNTRPYACPECPKRFHSRNNLNIHVERHSTPKHQCQYCHKMFTTNVGLRSHVKSHIRDRCHKCDICGKGFIHATSLKEHINGVHLQIRRKRKQCAIEDN